MSGLESFFSDDELMSLSAAPLHPSWDAVSAIRSEVRILKLLLAEVTILGRHISSVTSIVNAMEADGATRHLHDALLTYRPADPIVSTALAAKLLDTNVAIDVLEQLQEFHARLTLTLTMTVAFCRNPRDMRHKGGVHIEVLAGAWRDLSRHAASLLEALRVAAGEGETPDALRDRSDIAIILSTCANGGSPCVKLDGSIEVPGMAERRKETRWPVDWGATVLLGPSDVEATVLNISHSGICLRLDEGEVTIGQTICMALAGGRRLVGTVVWCRRELYGFRLSVPLLDGDPIVLAAQAAVQYSPFA